MLAWQTRKLEQLLDSLIDPLWAWVLTLAWGRRLAILVSCAVPLLTGLHWKDAHDVIASGVRLAAVVLEEDSYRIPISADHARRVEAAVDSLAQSLDKDFSDGESPFVSGIGAWTGAQLVVALTGLSLYAPEERFSNFFESQMDPECSCWREFTSSDGPRHLVASAWVLLALAHLDSTVPTRIVDFIVKTQTSEGWWPMYLYEDVDRENASTYATAQSLLALKEVLKRGLVSPEQVNAVYISIAKGRSWLVNSKDPEQPRWSDYPLSPRKKISLGLSGLVMVTLHRLASAAQAEREREWLAALPQQLPAADACEISQFWSDTVDGSLDESSCQVALAWLLSATIDAYPSGDLIQKLNTIKWVERVLNETDILRSETIFDNWKRAELLIALRHLARAADKDRSAVSWLAEKRFEVGGGSGPARVA